MLTTRLLPWMAIIGAMAWGTAASATPRDAAHSLFEAITAERSRYAHELIDYAVPAELLLLPDSVDDMEELSVQMDIRAFCALAERTHLVKELTRIADQEDQALRARLTAIERAAPGSLEKLQEIVTEFANGRGTWKLGLEAERIYRGRLPLIRKHLNEAFVAVAKHETHTECREVKRAAQLELRRVRLISDILAANHVLKQARLGNAAHRNQQVSNKQPVSTP